MRRMIGHKAIGASAAALLTLGAAACEADGDLDPGLEEPGDDVEGEGEADTGY